MKFRQLNAEEIRCKSYPNKGGVLLLLYKDARADMNILDESVGKMNWKKEYRQNHSCVVSIYDKDKQEWVCKEDLGEGEGIKNTATDAFKRACVSWGIGRALYKTPEIFIPSRILTEHTVERNPETGGVDCYCHNTFRVEEIHYNEEESAVQNVTIGIYEKKMLVTKVTFPNTEKNIPQKQTSATSIQTVASEVEKTDGVNEECQTTPDITSSNTSLFADDEVLLIGNCRGEKYCDVIKTEKFRSFLKWVETASCNYPDEARIKQMKKLKQLVKLGQVS